jgi:hypothetical protein
MFCAGILEPTISACASRQNSAVVAAAGAPDLRLASGAETQAGSQASASSTAIAPGLRVFPDLFMSRL